MANLRTSAAVAAAVLISFVAGAYTFGYLRSGTSAVSTDAKADANDATAVKTSVAGGIPSVELNDKQLQTVKVEPAGEFTFPIEKSAVGSIDFNEDMTVQVFTPYQGKIVDLFGKVGDEVKKGQTLFTIDSPDLLAAEANLISAAGVLELTTKALERFKILYETRAIAQVVLEQSVSDQQTAEGALRTARDAVRIFGKTDAEVDQIIKNRKADPTLIVPSPITGRITARNGQPGLLVQPGNAPGVYSVADISTMWMLANVAESDVSSIYVGQEVKVSLLSFPGKLFEGRISTVTSMVDPNSHRMLVRSDIDDPQHQLRSGMFATFMIRTGDPVRSPAVPLSGLVREGDGTNTVWVTTDRRRFTQRTVTVGNRKDGFRQILSGLKPGELVATDGAIFLSNMLAIGQAGG
jgi:cobalt-zinc-cadmium efflux system membrane fusion protein